MITSRLSAVVRNITPVVRVRLAPRGIFNNRYIATNSCIHPSARLNFPDGPWNEVEGPAGGAQALPGRPCPDFRVQGPPDCFGDRDRGAPAFGRRIATSDRKTRRPAGLLHQPVPPSGRGE